MAAGSPGPLEKNSPSAPVATTSSIVAVAGSTCTSMPRSLIIRGVLALMPRSIAATVNRFARRRAGTTYASCVETASLRLAPPHLGRVEHPLEQRRGVGLRRGDPDPHRPALAQVAGQRAGVDAGDADDALLAQRVVELRCERQLLGTRAGSRTT